MSGLGLTFLRRGGQAHPTAGSDYIKFKDEAVFSILMANGVSSDGVGITKDDAAKVTSIAQWFRNSVIDQFDELQFFVNVKSLDASAFNRSTVQQVNLKNVGKIDDYAFESATNNIIIEAPNLTSIGRYVFQNNSSLSSAYFPMVQSIGNASFKLCSSLKVDMVLEYLTTAENEVFRQSGITLLIAPILNSIPQSFLNRCTNLTGVYVGNISSVGRYACEGAAAMKSFVLNNVNVATLQYTDSFTNTSCSIYVPDVSVDAYKAASGWSTYASRIKGISQLATDDPTFYAKIEKYL